MRSGLRALLALAVAGAAIGSPARAQTEDRFTVKGLQDFELYKTDAGSLLLSRNDGDVAGSARLRLWTAADFTRGFEGVLLGTVEGGKATSEPGTQTAIEQAFVRYTSSGSARVMVDVGRIVVPVGNFPKRYLSSVNPLIGSPDSYDVSYPEGIVVTGKESFFDYRVGVIDRPLVNHDYVPDSDRSVHPAVDVGFTPITGLRLGAYYTSGPYLGHTVAAMLPAGASSGDYAEQVAGIELEFSRGYFELNGDLAYSTYEVPTYTALSRGQAWFLEPKYTLTPRLFMALRVEKNDYPYIMPVNSAFWINQNATFYDADLGAGWRFTPELILKASYRRDDWRVDESLKSYFPNGYSIGLQLSYSFDVRSWFEPQR